jgi:hypothetical protein
MELQDVINALKQAQKESPAGNTVVELHKPLVEKMIKGIAAHIERDFDDVIERMGEDASG